ncbi:hypothetical protein AB1E18_011562 [Capra hircus]
MDGRTPTATPRPVWLNQDMPTTQRPALHHLRPRPEEAAAQKGEEQGHDHPHAVCKVRHWPLPSGSERVSATGKSIQLRCQSIFCLKITADTPSPGDRRPDPFQYLASNGLALNPTQQEMLAHQALPRKSHPAAQESEAQNEIAPEDIKYRLETLPEAPLQLQHLSYFGEPKPPWIPLSTTYGESHKPWTYHGEEPSHSGDHYLTAHQIAFQNSPLGQSMFPVYIQGRNIASVMHPDYRDCVNQHQRDFQAPECNQVLKPDPDKSSQGIKPTEIFFTPCSKYIQTVRRLLAPVWQPTTHRHEKLSWPKQETPILGGKRAAKFDGDTVTRMSYLPPLQSLEKRVKVNCPSSTFRLLKAKLQAGTRSKQCFQDRGTQPRAHHGDPRHRGDENALGTASQAPAEDQTTTRTSYLPLFSERVNLCKPKVNSIKCETHILPLLSRGKHSGTKETLSHSQVSPAAHEPVPDIFMPKTGLNTEKKREKEREIGRKKLPK